MGCGRCAQFESVLAVDRLGEATAEGWLASFGSVRFSAACVARSSSLAWSVRLSRGGIGNTVLLSSADEGDSL